MPMFKQFADQHRVKVIRDVDGCDIIPGRNGNVYEFSQNRLGVIFIPATVRARKWNALRTEAIAAGMTLQQDGDSEGSFSFDPADRKQAAIALKIAGAKRKRQASVAQLANLNKGIGTRFQNAQRTAVEQRFSV